MANPWIDPDVEDRALAEADARRRRFARMQQTATPEAGQRAADLLRQHPNLSAGLLQALVAGQVPDEQAAQLAVEDDGGFFGSIADVAGDVIETVSDGAKFALDKAYEYGVKPAVRGLFTVADTLAQEVVQRPLTSAAAVAQGEADSFGEAYEAYGDSPGINALQGQGDIGTGFFAGGEAAAQSDRERTLTIRGQRADIGQAIANGLVGQFYAPGDRAYDVVAGVGGFAAEVAGDPLAWATLGASKGITAARTLSAKGAASILDDVGRFGDDVVERLRSSADEYVFHVTDAGSAQGFEVAGTGFFEGGLTSNLERARAIARGADGYLDLEDGPPVIMAWKKSDLPDDIRQRLSAGDIENLRTVDEDVVRDLMERNPSWSREDVLREMEIGDIETRAEDGLFGAITQTQGRMPAPAAVVSADDFLRGLSGAGAISSARRNTVLVERARDFFGNERMLQRLAEADAYTIMQTWAQSPANRIDIDTIRALGEATDQASVADVLFRAVEAGDVTRKGFYSGTGNFIKRNLVDSNSKVAGPFRYFTAEGKLSGLAPRGSVSADDLGDAAGKVDSLLRQTNVPREVRADVFNRIAAVQPGRNDELFPVLRDAYVAVAKQVDEGSEAFDEIVTHLNDQLNEMRQYGIDSWGDAVNVPYAKKKMVQNFDGEEVEFLVPTPQITSELRSLAFQLPDVTDLRRAATDNRVMRRVYQMKGWDFGADTTRSITRNVFKPLAILRPAYIVRIGAEEQARLAAAHYDSIWNHPFRFIQANVRNRKELTDLVGEDLIDVARANDIITKDAHGILADKAASQGRMFTTVSRTEGEDLSSQFVRGWRQELGQLSAAPEARQLALLRGDIGRFKTWAQNEGREHIERIAKVNADENRLLEFGDDFDQWADGLRRRIEAKTAGWDEDLVDRIVNSDIPFDGPTKAAKTNKAAFANFLRGKARQGRAPAKVKAELADEAHYKHLDSATNWLFDHITGKPTSWMARYPAFRQSLIRRTGDLLDSVSDNALRQEILDKADEAWKLTKAERKELVTKYADATDAAGPITDIRQFNEIVKTKSAEDVKQLLFDVTRRGAAQDAMEVVVPFLDAWKEVTKTWMRLVKENPSFFVRAQAGYRELQDQGHFYVNDFGDEVFQYPMGGTLAAFVRRMNESGGELIDIPGAAGGAIADTVTGNTPDYSVALEGRVQGVNLVAQGVGPGFGPVMQWGAGLFKSPDFDTLRSFVAPFGTGLSEPAEITDPGVLAETLMPAWARKMFNSWREGGIDERQWNSTVGDAVKALVGSGEYDPTEQDRLLRDAERFGKWLLVVRGAIQATGPTGPQATLEIQADADTDHPDWDRENDPDGTFFSVGVLASDYYRLLQTYGPEQAPQKFYEMYGAEPFFIAQGKTRSIKELPVDTEGDRWVRRNKGLVDDYPSVVGFFAPTDEDAELDFSVYAQQIERGDRQSLTPRQQVEMASQVRARAIYQAVKDRTEALPPAQRDRAREVTKARLEEVHPGWSAPVLGVAQGGRLTDRIAELERAANDPRLEDNPAVAPLRTYLRLRELMLAEANERGLKTLSSDRVADLRNRLHEAGMAIQQRYPEFVSVWSGLLSREVGA